MDPYSSYRGFVYLIGSTNHCWYKIGQSKNAETRVKDLGVLLPFRIEVFAVWKTTNRLLLESLMHEKYKESAINGEWFHFGMKEREKIIRDQQPHDAVLTMGNIYSFSNIAAPAPKLRHLAAPLVERYLTINKLEHTPENLTKAWSDSLRIAKEQLTEMENRRILDSD